MPAEKLHVENGNILISKTPATTTSGSMIFKLNSANQNAWGIEHVNSTIEGYGLNFWNYKDIGTPSKDYAKCSILFLDRYGSIGMGTTNPTAKLDVAGAFKASSATLSGALTAQSAIINGNANITGTITGNALSANSATITGNANITGTLTANLLNATNATISNRVTSKELRVEHTASTDWNYASQIKVNRNLTKALVINNSSTNQDVFVVYGNGVLCTKKIFTEKIEVTLNAMNNSWYDHVFYSNYDLRSLSELEQYIKQNNHLPEIPSAREVQENGLDLGEMQGKLLLKIEELTLYTIEQQKLIENLQKRLTEVENMKGGE
jgi:hypothetical protein